MEHQHDLRGRHRGGMIDLSRDADHLLIRRPSIRSGQVRSGQGRSKRGSR